MPRRHDMRGRDGSPRARGSLNWLWVKPNENEMIEMFTGTGTGRGFDLWPQNLDDCQLFAAACVWPWRLFGLADMRRLGDHESHDSLLQP